MQSWDYVRLTSFRRRTSEELANVLNRLEQDGMKGLVLDLRFNPGGLLDEGRRTAALFVGDVEIVRIKSASGKVHVFWGEEAARFPDVPMACLINRETAMSSEFVSACLQDYNRAVIVGERSKGHACVQNNLPCEDVILCLTSALFVRPDGGRKLERMKLFGWPDDQWGVCPNRGYRLGLLPEEHDRLRAALSEAEIVARLDADKESIPFGDWQRDLALACVREKIKQ